MIKEKDVKKSLYSSIRRNILENEFPKEKICEKNNISEEVFDDYLALFDFSDDVLKKLDENNAKYAYIKQLCADIPAYLVNGINVGGEIYDFNVLDYAYLTDLSAKKFKMIFVETASKNIDKIYDVALAKLLYQVNELGCSISRERFVSQKRAGSINGIEYRVNEEVANYIYDLFEENNIRPKSILLDKAIVRYYKSEPILPLKEIGYLEKKSVFIKKK